MKQLSNSLIRYHSPRKLKLAHEGDAGYDIIASSEPKIVGSVFDRKNNLFLSIDYIEYKTNVYIAPVYKFFTMVFPRSSIAASTNLVLANSIGLIDSGYRNEICLRFKYIFQPKDLVYFSGYFGVKVDEEKIYHKGDRIGQLVFFHHTDVAMKKISLSEIEDIDSSRGKGGFGSTGK